MSSHSDDLHTSRAVKRFERWKKAASTIKEKSKQQASKLNAKRLRKKTAVVHNEISDSENEIDMTDSRDDGSGIVASIIKKSSTLRSQVSMRDVALDDSQYTEDFADDDIVDDESADDESADDDSIPFVSYGFTPVEAFINNVVPSSDTCRELNLPISYSAESMESAGTSEYQSTITGSASLDTEGLSEHQSVFTEDVSYGTGTDSSFLESQFRGRRSIFPLMIKLRRGPKEEAIEEGADLEDDSYGSDDDGETYCTEDESAAPIFNRSAREITSNPSMVSRATHATHATHVTHKSTAMQLLRDPLENEPDYLAEYQNSRPADTWDYAMCGLCY